MPIPVFNPLQNQQITSAMVNLTAQTADVATQETTTSTSYTDLATGGPAVTLSPGVTQDQRLDVAGSIANGSAAAYSYMSIAIAAAAAADGDSARHAITTLLVSSRGTLATAVASGGVHTAKYRVTANTGTYAERRSMGMAI